MTMEDEALANVSWELITSDRALGYLDVNKSETATTSCLSFFYDEFYFRVFDVHPASRIRAVQGEHESPRQSSREDDRFGKEQCRYVSCVASRPSPRACLQRRLV